MKNAFKILVITCILSCNHLDLDEERILKIGNSLVQTEYSKTNFKETSDIVILGNGLKGNLIELQKNTTNFDFEINKGDLPFPFGNNTADAILSIKTEYKSIKIRLKYDKAKDKYHVLGFKTD